jgi:DinB superfamily
MLPAGKNMSSMTDAERAAALAELEASRDRLLGALAGLAPEQWQARPTHDRWSISECAEHITAAEVPLPKLYKSSIAVEPPAQERPQIRLKDDYVRTVLRDRSRHQDAPERLLPKSRFATPEETVRTFRERREANLDFVRATSEALRDWFAPHPFAGLIDGYQWILFLAAHTDRHAEQIEEIREAPGFPRRA